MNIGEQGESGGGGRGVGLADPPPGRERLRTHGLRIALALALAVFTYLLFPASPAVDFPVYEVGSVASARSCPDVPRRPCGGRHPADDLR